MTKKSEIHIIFCARMSGTLSMVWLEVLVFTRCYLLWLIFRLLCTWLWWWFGWWLQWWLQWWFQWWFQTPVMALDSCGGAAFSFEYIITSAEGRRICYRFRSSVRLSVCMSVCPSVNSLTRKVLCGFSWNFYQVFLIIKGRTSSILWDLAKKTVAMATVFGIFQG